MIIEVLRLLWHMCRSDTPQPKQDPWDARRAACDRFAAEQRRRSEDPRRGLTNRPVPPGHTLQLSTVAKARRGRI
jgi:hypothetical protein